MLTRNVLYHCLRVRISVLYRPFSTKKDRTPSVDQINRGNINDVLISQSGSNWSVEHAANIGIRWDPEMKLQAAHPAACYGPVLTLTDILKDPTTTENMKGFIAPIMRKDGPNHTDHFSDFAKETRQQKKGWSILSSVCEDPQRESSTRQMIIELTRAVGLHNTLLGLAAKIEYPIITHFMLGTVFAQPELVIGKEIEEDVLYQLVFSEAKPLKPESRARGEGQVVGETTAAMLYNYAKTKAALPVIIVYVNGYFLRFISCVPQKKYVSAVAAGNLKGAKPPVFSTYPAYDDKTGPKLQGFNLLTATGRIAAVEALLQIRHNLICACPQFRDKSS